MNTTSPAVQSVVASMLEINQAIDLEAEREKILPLLPASTSAIQRTKDGQVVADYYIIGTAHVSTPR